MDGITSFIENEVKWCEEHSSDVTCNPPSPEFQAGFIAGLKQVQEFIENYSDILKIE